MSGAFGPSPPSAPNPYQVATAQTASNVGTATAQSRLNNVNQVTPYGSVNYNYQPSGTKVGGQNVPQITQTTTLTPEQQALLDQQQKLQGQTGALASRLEGNVPTAALNYDNATKMPGVQAVTPGAMPNPNALPTPGAMPALQTVQPSNLPTLQAQPDVGKTAADARQAAYDQQTMYLDPQFQLQERQLHDSLQGQGIPAGSEAYNQAMDQFNRQKTFAYQSATDSSIKQGYDVANQQFNQGLQANQQGYQQGMDEAQTGFGQNLASNQQSYTQGMGEQGTAFDQGMSRATTGFNQGMTAEEQKFNQGLSANQNLFGQGLQSRQQGISEAGQLYNQPISTLGALMSAYGGGNVQAPTATAQPSAIAPTSIAGSFGPQQDAYSNQSNKYAADVGGASSLASMIAMGLMKP